MPFASLLEVLPHTAKAAQHGGGILSEFEKAGQPIGINDLHTAAHALIERLTLVGPKPHESSFEPGC